MKNGGKYKSVAFIILFSVFVRSNYDTFFFFFFFLSNLPNTGHYLCTKMLTLRIRCLTVAH